MNWHLMAPIHYQKLPYSNIWFGLTLHLKLKTFGIAVLPRLSTQTQVQNKEHAETQVQKERTHRKLQIQNNKIR